MPPPVIGASMDRVMTNQRLPAAALPTRASRYDRAAAAIIGVAGVAALVLDAWFALSVLPERSDVPYPGLMSSITLVGAIWALLTIGLAVGIARHGRRAKILGLVASGTIAIACLSRVPSAVADLTRPDPTMAPDVALYLGLGGAAAAVAILLWKAGIPPAGS
jgi:hypothetical protein